MSRKRAGSSSAPSDKRPALYGDISSSTMRFAVERYAAALDANEMLRSAAQLDDVRTALARLKAVQAKLASMVPTNWAEAILPDVWRQLMGGRVGPRGEHGMDASKGPLRRYLCPKDLHALALTCKRLHRIAREQTRVLLIWSRAAPLGSSDWRRTLQGYVGSPYNARQLDPLRSLPRCTLVMIDCMRSTSGWHRQAMLHMLLQQVDLSKCVLGFDGVECMNHGFAATWLPHAALVRAFRTFLFTDISALVLFVQDFCVGDMPPVTLLYAGDVPPVTLHVAGLGTVLVDRVCLCGAASQRLIDAINAADIVVPTERHLMGMRSLVVRDDTGILHGCGLHPVLATAEQQEIYRLQPCRADTCRYTPWIGCEALIHP